MAGLFVNKNFFNSWNSEMAYVLGFVVADGCVGVKRTRKKDGTKQYYFNITSKDKPHLENIKKAMSAQQPIHSKRSGHKTKKDYYFIQIGHQDICRDLLKLGVWPRKTYNLGPVNVPNKYFPDFVRGFFDGDGSVYRYGVNKVLQIKAKFMSTSLTFITHLNQQLCRELNIPKKSIHQEYYEKSKIPQYLLYFYIDDCEKLATFMYRNNPTLYLPRKRIIFEKWKSINRRHYIKQNYPSKIGWHLNQKIFA